MRISKIDYETKMITLDGNYDDLKVGDIIPVKLIALYDGQILRKGMSIEADGIDENGQLINPRRVEEGPAPCEAGPTD